MAKRPLSFLTTTGTKHTVNGQELTFYPIRLPILMGEIRTFIAPLLKIVSEMISGGQTSGTKESSSGSGDGGEIMVISEVTPIDPQLYNAITNKRNENITELTNAIFSEEGQDTLGRLILDSLRAKPNDFISDDEVCPNTPQEWAAMALDSSNIVDFIAGVLAANKEAFTPLARTLGGVGQTVSQRVTEVMKESLVPMDVQSTVPDSNDPPLQ